LLFFYFFFTEFFPARSFFLCQPLKRGSLGNCFGVQAFAFVIFDNSSTCAYVRQDPFGAVGGTRPYFFLDGVGKPYTFFVCFEVLLQFASEIASIFFFFVTTRFFFPRFDSHGVLVLWSYTELKLI